MRPLLAPAGLVLVALLAFWMTLRVGFMWDDHRMIENNPRMAMTAANLASAFRGDPFAQGLNYYRPLQTVSNMADFAVWGLRPFGYHLTNFLYHAAAALLFFYLALALGLGRPAAFWAAALLAAHPAAVEQLLIIAGRAELSSAACTLASLLLFLKGRRALSFILFLAACGFKENGVITPALTALCLWYLRRDRGEYRALLPFFAFIPVYLFLRHQALGMGALPHGLGPAVSGLFLKVPASLLAYLKEAVLPFDMHSHRMQPDWAPLRWAALPLLAAAGWALRRHGGRLALFCAGWYLLNLAPKLPLLTSNDLMLDHWVYLANAGLFLWAADKLAANKEHRPLLPLAAGLLIAANFLNIPSRDTDLRIYEHAALKSSSKPMLYNLAREYYLAGRWQKSRLLLERVSAGDPSNALYLDGLSLARSKDGDPAGAMAASDAALKLKPGDRELLLNRYGILMEAGKKKDAAALLDGLLAARPDFGPAWLAAARARLAEGRGAEAEAAYRRAIELNPADLEALNDCGILLAKRGDYDGAEKLFLRALALAPGGGARQNLFRLRELRAAKP